jgi:PAS domain S-box-containing protein
MPLHLNRSLRITIGISLALLCMQGALSLVVFDNFRTAIRQNVEKQQFSLVGTLAHQIDDQIEQHIGLVRDVASAAPAEVFAGGSRGRAFLERHAEISKVFDHGTFLLGANGELAAEFPFRSAETHGGDVSRRSQINEAISRRTPMVSQPYLSSIYGEPVITFFAPVLNRDGSLRGLVGGTLSLVHDNFFSNIAQARIGTSGYLYLVGKDRTVIVHPDRSRLLTNDVPPKANLLYDRALAGFEGGGETVNSRGLHTISAFKSLKNAPWILAANFPVKEAYAPLGNATRNLLAAFAVTFLGSGVALRLIAGRMKGEVTKRAEAESYADLLLDSVGEGVLGITKEGRISFVNRAAWQLLGYHSQEPLLGQDARELLHHAARQCPQCLREECLFYPASASGHPQQSEDQLLWRKDGSCFVADFSCTSLRRAGEKHGAVITFRDTSERREARDRLHLQGAALEAAANSILIADPAGEIIWVNRAFSVQTGYQPHEAIGQSPVQLLSGCQDQAVSAALWETINDKQPWHGVVVSRRKDGSLYDEDVTITPVLDGSGEITQFIGIMQDVTERKLFEEALLQGNLALEEANVRLVRAKNRANQLAQKAERANAAKSEFLANMSHEIRTPMNAVVGISHLLKDTPLTSQQDSYLQTLTVSAESLMRIIDDILDFSKIEAGRLDIDRVEFCPAELLEELVASYAGRAQEKGLELRAQVEPAIAVSLWGDPQRLAQILNNLLANSLKFTKQGFIALGASVVKPGSDLLELEFRIEDSGIGIAPAQQEQLFQPFMQVDGSITRTYGGTGLGLAICKRLTTLMGGRIWCESAPGAGSVFICRLPFAVVQGESAAASSRAASADLTPFNGERILLVEDNVFNQKVAVALLEKGGLLVTVASNGVEALELLAQRDFDLVLMDIQMPVMDGLTAAREIRKLAKPGIDSLPILALSANAMGEDVSRSLAAGMNAHINKPFTPESLYGPIALWLGFSIEEANVATLPPAPAPTALPQACRPLDAETGIRQIGGDADLYRELLSRFLQEYEGKVEDLRSEFGNGDVQHAVRLAHSVKGIAGVLAAVPLQLAAQGLETAMATGDAATGSFVEQFLQELSAAIASVEDRLAGS